MCHCYTMVIFVGDIKVDYYGLSKFNKYEETLLTANFVRLLFGQ